MSTTYYDGAIVHRNGGYTDTTTTVKAVTTNATPHAVYSIVLPTLLMESHVLECRFIGYVIAGNDVFIGYTVMANNDLGTITVYGGNTSPEYPMALIRDGAVSMDTCAVSSTVVGNTLSINVIGLVGVTVNWAGTIRVMRSIHDALG